MSTKTRLVDAMVCNFWAVVWPPKLPKLEEKAKPSTSTRAEKICDLLRQLLESLEDESPT